MPTNDIIDDSPDEGQDPNQLPTYSPLLPDLSSLSVSNESIGNAQILMIGSLAINTILTGSPAPESYSIPDLVTAAAWLWRWHLAAAGAESKEEFIEVMAFLLKD